MWVLAVYKHTCLQAAPSSSSDPVDWQAASVFPYYQHKKNGNESIMNIPNLPTDNLYKFMSLSGLIIAFGPAIYWLTLTIDFKYELIDESMKLNTAKLKIDRLSNKQDDLRAMINDIDKLIEKETLSPDQPHETLKSMMDKNKNIQKFDTEINEAIEAQELENIQLTATRKKVKTLQEDIFILYLVSMTCFAFGIHLSNKGFRLWHKRVQQPIDQVLKNNAKNTKSWKSS